MGNLSFVNRRGIEQNEKPLKSAWTDISEDLILNLMDRS